MGSPVSKIALQVPSSLCTDTLFWSGEWLSSFHVFFYFCSLYHSFLDAFSLISSSFLFLLFFLVFFTCFLSLLPLHSSFPPVWQSLILAWNWLPYIGSQTTTLCQELSWLLWSSRVREVYFQENAFSSSSSLHVACVCSIATSVLQIPGPVHTWLCGACWSPSRYQAS